ncbi:MAG TPA: hypothetical protein VGC90_04265 [Candidatus Limnocylindrales bacterium]
MAQLHLALAWVAVVAAASTVVAGAILAAGRSRSYALLDKVILVQAVAAAAAGIVGLALVATGGAVRDLLHVVYAAVAVGTIIGTRYAVHSHDPRRAGRWIAVAGVIVLGAMIRLFMTGR